MMVMTALPACSGGDTKGEISSASTPETETVRLAVFQQGHILNAIAEAQDTSPSRPSVKFTAFEKPTNQKIIIKM